MKRALSIKYWLLIANAFLLLVPLFGLIFLRLWDRHLVRVTEERLIAESTLVAEAWLQEMRRELDLGSPPPERVRRAPVEPRLVGSYDVLPAPVASSKRIEPQDTPAWRAAARMDALLHRVRSRGATAMYVLDPEGCILATAGHRVGTCLDHLEEVHEALAGNYAARARERAIPRSFTASDIGRSGAVRVSTAFPVRLDGAIVGVVHASQRSGGPLEAILEHRRVVLFAAFACIALMLAITGFLTWAISRPVRKVTQAAQAVARGEPPPVIPVALLAPSELGALSASVNRMTELLTDRAEYIANFAAAVSHELKSPITSIRGAVELLQDEGETMSAEQRRRFFANIAAATQRMHRLVNRLLELARIQSAPEQAAEIDVRRFFEALAASYGERVRLQLDEQLGELVIPPDHLDSAVRNLVDNGLRHGGGEPIDVRVRRAGEGLCIEVRDYGPGISEGNRRRIFERFFTTERDRGGTGLGLAIVQAVAETRGGRVEFETGDRGSVFRVFL